MKIIFTSFLLFTLQQQAAAQSIERKLVGVNGSTLINGGYQLSYAIGEVAIRTTPYIPSNGTYFFATIGFLQPLAAQSGVVTVSNNWMSAYPNPATSFVRIDVHGFYPQDNVIKVTNALGQQVIVPPATFKNGSAEINVSSLAKGTYIISVTETGTSKPVTAKIIKL